MSLHHDTTFLTLISSRLQKFVHKGNHLYNFRCPICMDSQKDKKKARGFCYPEKNNLFYKCHNCGLSTTFPNFLRTLDPILYKDYIMERFKSGEFGKSNYKKSDILTNPESLPVLNTVNKNKGKVMLPSNLLTIKELDIKHPAKQYLNSRLIPVKLFSKIYFTEDFKSLVSLLDTTDHNLIAHESRIVFPFYDADHNLIAIQGRSLAPKSKLRYITIKIDKTAPKVFGLDTVNMNIPFYVLEGPIDAMMLDNAIAAAGSDFPKNLNKDNAVLIFDHEPRKVETVSKVKKAINSGYKVCLWPSTIQEKDVNEMVINGLNPFSIIQERTYQGLEAQVKFSQWSKI
jgi:hypothetical protein